MSDDGFRFSLARVLELRAEREREQAKTLARARREAAGAEEARANLEGIRDTRREDVQQAHNRGGSVGHLQNLGLIVERLEESVRHAEEACRAAEEHVVETLEEFRQAFTDRHTLDRLRDRRREEWEMERARAEQKEMDEVALNRHGRSELRPEGDR